MNIKASLFDLVPFKRKSALDWVVPTAVGAGIGLVAGVAIGLLYAPETGEEARLHLREGAYRVKERAASLAEKAKDRLSSTAGQLKEQASRV